MVRLIVPASLTASVVGHGYINEPPSRTGAMKEAGGTAPYGSTLWFNQGCSIGCPKCLGVDGGFNGCGDQQGTETLPQAYKTYNVGKASCGINPWCAPGSAPIMDPCGVAGGDHKQGAAGNGGDAPPGYKLGDLGTEMRDGVKGLHRTWKVGDAVEVSWAIIANHGGGYQYRLCPLGQETEECFQKTPLEFIGDEQEIQYCEMPEDPALGLDRYATPDGFNHTHKVDPATYYASLPGCDKKNRTIIPAMRINKGTIPEGSSWTRNPIPPCKNGFGGAFNVGCHVSSIVGKYSPPDASQFQFPPAGEDANRPGLLLGGFGAGACFGCNQDVNPPDCDKFGKAWRNNCTVDETDAQVFTWNIVDKVRVPKVTPGKYVVSFRWESEQTPQIWSTCSDVTIVASETVV